MIFSQQKHMRKQLFYAACLGPGYIGGKTIRNRLMKTQFEMWSACLTSRFDHKYMNKTHIDDIIILCKNL